jgi:hypothetical protein
MWGYPKHHPGWFGAVRKHDIHAGVDLYVRPLMPMFAADPRSTKSYHENECVACAFEAGTVVEMGQFTGEAVDCGWWNDSNYVAVQGVSGIIVYGEIEIESGVAVGMKVNAGARLGRVVQILKKPPREQIAGHSMLMLHVELHKADSLPLNLSGWSKDFDSKRPCTLKDPSIYISTCDHPHAGKRERNWS